MNGMKGMQIMKTVAMQRGAWHLVVAVFAACANLCAAPAPLVFDTPAADEKGIMILGNGELGAVAWLTADGTLHTVLQNSDSWNEGGHHVKTGAIDYTTGMPVDKGSFLQELSMERGEFAASWKSRGKPVSVRYRVQQGTDSIVACDVCGAPKCEAKVVNWRLYPSGSEDFGGPRFDEGYFSENVKGLKFSVSADRLVPGGWCHVNSNETVAKMMKVYDYYQGTGDLGKEDFLSNRAFGGITRRAAKDDRVLFLSAITCLHPCKDAVEWQRRTETMLDACGWTLDSEGAKRAEHIVAWRAFWDRSHIQVTPAKNGAKVRRYGKLTVNGRLPIRFGEDSKGENRFVGSFGQAEVSFGSRTAFAGVPEIGERIGSPRIYDIEVGFRFSCRFTTKDAKLSQRILDNMTPGGSDGFIIDIYKGRVRMIMGRHMFSHPCSVPTGKEVSLAVEVSPLGEVLVDVDGVPMRKSIGRAISLDDECRAITTAYAAQRYMTACAGKGRLPIRFNGSLFTIAHKGNWDHRRWGSGYWWQNTRLPYYAMFAAGDVDMTDPLFDMYLGLLDFNKKRTRKYLGHGGAYFPECMQPWGDHFVGTYGPECEWKDRKDKLQAGRHHKYAWVGQLELSFLAIMRWEHTQDDAWFKSEALPSIREYVRYFDEHYKQDAHGRYLMYPAQAIEACWDCANPMTELSGLYAVTERLLAMPERMLSKEDRELFTKIRARLPELPTRKLGDGTIAYAIGEKFSERRNPETPELYCVFPFRICAFEKPNLDLGRRAYTAPRIKFYIGWSQEELNAAYLGMTEESRVHIAERALTQSKPQYRWPAYWGPNVNWCPDGDEGGVYQNTIQSMLMQYDGRKIFLLPAWPKDWDCLFKLHAPYNTTVEGRVENGELKDLVVTPASRRADIAKHHPDH